MDLAANIVASVLAFLASVLGNVLAHDLCVSADRNCSRIIRKAASRLADSDRQSGEAEWIADLQERETVREKYQHAIGCFMAAGKMRRQSEAVLVAMSFQIAGLGTVPLSLNLNSRFMAPIFFKAMDLKPSWIQKIVVILAMFYLLTKFMLSAKATLPPGFKLTQEHLQQYKLWGYGAQIRIKGRNLDFGKIFQFMVLHPNRIGELIRIFNASLQRSDSSQVKPESKLE